MLPGKHSPGKLSGWLKMINDPSTQYSPTLARNITSFVSELEGEYQMQAAWLVTEVSGEQTVTPPSNIHFSLLSFPTLSSISHQPAAVKAKIWEGPIWASARGSLKKKVCVYEYV